LRGVTVQELLENHHVGVGNVERKGGRKERDGYTWNPLSNREPEIKIRNESIGMYLFIENGEEKRYWLVLCYSMGTSLVEVYVLLLFLVRCMYVPSVVRMLSTCFPLTSRCTADCLEDESHIFSHIHR